MTEEDPKQEKFEEIKKLVTIARRELNHGNFDPAKFLVKSQEILRSAWKNGIFDPFDETENLGRSAHAHVSNFLREFRFFWATEQVLTEWWNDFGNYQRQEKQYSFRAVIAYHLMNLYLHQHDYGAALRWGLLTQACDILGGHPEDGGAGKQLLLIALGMRQHELDELNVIARTNREVVESKKDWSLREGYAENVVLKFALRGTQYAHLIGQEASITNYSLSEAYFQILLERVTDESADTYSKGEIFEELASYLLLLIPGLVPQRKVMPEDKVFENDIVVANISRSSNLASELLGRHFLVECKNWNKSVGTSEVGYFLHRMRLTHAKFGIMFAREGISGDDDGKQYAHSLIRRTFHEDSAICIVLDKRDLDTLAEREIGIWSMLFARLEQFRFGKSQIGSSI